MPFGSRHRHRFAALRATAPHLSLGLTFDEVSQAHSEDGTQSTVVGRGEDGPCHRQRVQPQKLCEPGRKMFLSTCGRTCCCPWLDATGLTKRSLLKFFIIFNNPLCEPLSRSGGFFWKERNTSICQHVSSNAIRPRKTSSNYRGAYCAMSGSSRFNSD